MNYKNISRYAWFANLAYVKWEKTSNSTNNQYNAEQGIMIDAAAKDEDNLNTPEALANKIFNPDELNYSVKFYKGVKSALDSLNIYCEPIRYFTQNRNLTNSYGINSLAHMSQGPT